MHDFRRLLVWQQARELGADVHRLTRSFPRSGRQALSSQLQRSAFSIGANIAEGCGRGSRAASVRFLRVAARSAAETEHQLIVAGELGVIPPRAVAELTGRAIAIQRMLRALGENFPE